MKKYFEILGLEKGASKQDVIKAYNKLSKELDPKENHNQPFFVEEFNKLKEAYEALINSSILTSKKTTISNKNSDTNNDKDNSNEKDSDEYSLSDKSSNMKKAQEIIGGIISILMIKVLSQFFFFPEYLSRTASLRRITSDFFRIDISEIFLIDEKYDYSLKLYVFAILFYLTLRLVFLFKSKEIFLKILYVFIITMMLSKISLAIDYSG